MSLTKTLVRFYHKLAVSDVSALPLSVVLAVYYRAITNYYRFLSPTRKREYLYVSLNLIKTSLLKLV